MSSVELVYSTNDDEFHCDDLMEVIGEIDEPKAGDTVYVGEKKRPDVGDFIDADNVIDEIANAGWDFGGEYAEDFPDVSAEAKEELATLVAEDLIERGTISEDVLHAYVFDADEDGNIFCTVDTLEVVQ